MVEKYLKSIFETNFLQIFLSFALRYNFKERNAKMNEKLKYIFVQFNNIIK